MRIALICTNDLPVHAVQGGAIQITVENLARHFRGKAHITVFSLQLDKLPATEVIDGVQYVRCARRGYIYSVLQHLRAHPPDVTIVCNRPAWVPAVRRACPRTRLVLSLHTHRMHPGWTVPVVARRAIRAADAIATVSRFLARSLLRHYPHAYPKVQVIYSGVEPERFAPVVDPDESRRQFGVSGRQVVLFVGRLTRSKGVHVLLRAMPLIRRRHPRAVLLVVGSRWFHGHRTNGFVRQLQRSARKQANRIRFTGFLEPEHVHRAFQAAEVLVCPSQWREPLARVLYEGMASGLPIVTTARGGNPEVIQQGRTGFVVRRWRSPVSLARAVSVALADSNRKKLGDQGRLRVLQRYTWEAAAQRWLRLLENLMHADAVPGRKAG